MESRYTELTRWLSRQCATFTLHPLQEDASFRRYFRVFSENQTFIAMDAPPDKENCLPFICIAEALRNLGLMTPEVIAKDIGNGFLLLTDFGDKVYLNQLNNDTVEPLYTKALDTLAILQTCRGVSHWEIPTFTATIMRQELELFKDWFLIQHLGLKLNASVQKKLNVCFDLLADSAAKQPYVFMHRDYHSANLMRLPNDEVGILDFQDAFLGPITYDLVSLVRDCYIAWPDTLVYYFVKYYWEKLELTIPYDEFLTWFEIMSLQRHLKALLTFSRKYHRDKNANYLKHIPRTLQYIGKTSLHFPETLILNEIIQNKANLCVE